MGANLKIPIDTGGSYVASAIAQWIFVFFFCCFFFTFFREAQEYSLLIVIETHTTHEPEAEDSKPDFKKLSQNGGQITKPAPEMRKILRRDSTCQTMTDTLNDILSSKNGITNGTKDGNKFPAKTDVANGKSKILSNSEVDAKLTRLLSECESANDELKLKEIDAENSTTTTVAENGTTTTVAENSTITIYVENSVPNTEAENSATTTAAENSAAMTGAENSAITPDTENKTTDDVNEDLMAANGIMEITKEDADKEEERIVIEQIDVAVKDEEDAEDNKMTAEKTEKVEAQPSNCPMSVQ